MSTTNKAITEVRNRNKIDIQTIAYWVKDAWFELSTETLIHSYSI